MNFLLSLLSFAILSLGSLSPFAIASSRAQDETAKSDINAIASALEMHYTRNGEYPTEKELTREYDTALPGINTEVLFDEDRLFINKGSYTYNPTNCTALGCQKYELQAKLADGSLYKKSSVR